MNLQTIAPWINPWHEQNGQRSSHCFFPKNWLPSSKKATFVWLTLMTTATAGLYFKSLLKERNFTIGIVSTFISTAWIVQFFLFRKDNDRKNNLGNEIIHSEDTSTLKKEVSYQTIREWTLENKKAVRLLQAEDQLALESVVDGIQVATKLRWNRKEHWPSLEIQNFIEKISRRRPSIDVEGRVSFLPERETSIFGNSTPIPISESKWAITLINTDRNPWPGHAAIIIEGIENGDYKIWKAHILPPHTEEEQKKNIAAVDFHKLEDSGYLLKCERYKTIIQGSALVKNMIQQIQIERDAYNNNKPLIFFSEYGSHPRFNSFCRLHGTDPISLNITPEGNPLFDSYNCITWARKSLHIAKIDLPEQISPILIPSLYTTNSLTKKILHTTGGFFLRIFDTLLQIAYLRNHPEAADNFFLEEVVIKHLQKKNALKV